MGFYEPHYSCIRVCRITRVDDSRGNAGRVQGVGFRWWVRSQALELGLVGFAENLTDGRVKVVAEGPRGACGELLDRLAGPGTPGQVTALTHRWDEPRGGLTGFAER